MNLNWHELALNPESITSLYSVAPTLEKVELFKLEVDRDNPSVVLTIDISYFPDRPPKHWHTDFNSVILKLRFIDISSFRADGISRNMKVNVSITRNGTNEVQVEVQGEDLKFEFSAAFFRIEKISGYIDEAKTRP